MFVETEQSTRIEHNPLVTKVLEKRAEHVHKKAKTKDRERRVAELLPDFETSFVALLNAAGHVATPKWRIGKPEYVGYTVMLPLTNQKDPLKVMVRGQTYPSDTTDEGVVLSVHGFDMYIDGMNSAFNQDLDQTTIKDRWSNADGQWHSRQAKPSDVRAYTDLATQLTEYIVNGNATVLGEGQNY